MDGMLGGGPSVSGSGSNRIPPRERIGKRPNGGSCLIRFETKFKLGCGRERESPLWNCWPRSDQTTEFLEQAALSCRHRAPKLQYGFLGCANRRRGDRASNVTDCRSVSWGFDSLTGLGLAMVAAIKGYRAVFTMPDKMSREKIDLLKALGARVVVTPTAVPPDHPESYYRVAERIHRETPNSVLPNQYANQANPRAHYETTGPEIWRDTDGKVTHFVCGMGTGGTISGVGSYLKEKNPKVRIIGVDPLGSILKDYFYKKEAIKPHTYKIEGIGEDFIPESTWFQYIDEIVKVADKESYLMTRRLAREEAILAGSSSGSAVVAARRIAETLGPNDVLVVLLPDTGERYLSKAHNEEWLKEP